MKLLNQLFILFTLLHLGTSIADTAIENRVRAAFVLQFTKYVEWPSLTEPLKIAIIDDSGFYEDVKESLKKFNSDKKIEPVEISFENFKKSKADFRIVVFPKGNDAEVKKTLAATKGLPVLTITSGDLMQLKGSDINFYSDDNHLRFEIDSENALASNLKIGAQLLKLGRKRD